jgi:hypothetical protein
MRDRSSAAERHAFLPGQFPERPSIPKTRAASAAAQRARIDSTSNLSIKMNMIETRFFLVPLFFGIIA